MMRSAYSGNARSAKGFPGDPGLLFREMGRQDRRSVPVGDLFRLTLRARAMERYLDPGLVSTRRRKKRRVALTRPHVSVSARPLTRGRVSATPTRSRAGSARLGPLVAALIVLTAHA